MYNNMADKPYLMLSKPDANLSYTGYPANDPGRAKRHNAA